MWLNKTHSALNFLLYVFFVFKQQWSCAKINLEVRPTERGGLIPEVNPYHQNKGFQIVRMESNGYNLRFMSCHIIYSLYHQSCSLLPAAIDRESNPCCFLVSSTGKNCTSVFFMASFVSEDLSGYIVQKMN